MHEYVTVSSSSYDPAALASKLTEKSGEGWEVVSIVQTGGDVTAFLRRTAGEVGAIAAEEPSEAAEIESAVSEPEPEPEADVVTTEPEVAPEPEVIAGAAAGGALVDSVPEAEVTPEPVAEPEPVSEPAGWAASPEPEPVSEPEPAISATEAAVGAGAVAAAEPVSSVYSPDPTPAATASPEPVAAVQEPVAAQPTVPAGWYADPSGRYELRYWDGNQWTEHVARGGQQFTDAPVA